MKFCYLTGHPKHLITVLIRFFKMIWIVLETQLLLRVHKSIALLIVVSPIVAFVLFVQFYAAPRLPNWVVPIIYIGAALLVAGVWSWKLLRSRKLSKASH